MKNLTELLEMHDVVRSLGLTAQSLNKYVATGELAVFARTRRGVRLFEPKVVAAFKRRHEARRRSVSKARARAAVLIEADD